MAQSFNFWDWSSQNPASWMRRSDTPFGQLLSRGSEGSFAQRFGQRSGYLPPAGFGFGDPTPVGQNQPRQLPAAPRDSLRIDELPDESVPGSTDLESTYARPIQDRSARFDKGPEYDLAGMGMEDFLALAGNESEGQRFLRWLQSLA